MDKKLLFDLTATQPSSDAKFHGGSDYAKAVFVKMLEKTKNFSCLIDPIRTIDSDIALAIKRNNLGIVNLSNENTLEKILNSGLYTTFFSALPYEYYNLEAKSVNFIYVIHGLRSLELPADKYEIKFSNNLFKKYHAIAKQTPLLKRYVNSHKQVLGKLISGDNKTIIAVSNHTKYSIIESFPDVDPDNVHVFYSPIYQSISQEKFKQGFSPLFLKKLKESEKYFLLISANRWLKNSYRTIKAFDELFENGFLKDKKVIVLGLPNNHIFKLRNKNRFIFNDYVSYNELEYLFENAFCFVYSTLNEGFGYPPLQAMRYGTVVISSCITSTSEVCGDSVLYFNPYDIKEIKNRILQVDMDSGLVSKLGTKGKERFSFINNLQNKMLDELIERLSAYIN